MTSSDSDRVNFQHGHNGELLDLADLAGIKGPGNTMGIVIELLSMGLPPREVHQLLRDILASKSRMKRASASARASAKSTSRRSVASSEAIQENTAPHP